MPLTVGINHVTATTAYLDRLVAFYVEMFGAEKLVDRSPTAADARFAIVDLGGGRYVKVVEDAAAVIDPGPARSTAGEVTERFGLAVGSHQELQNLRQHMVVNGARIGEIERLPTQWVLRVTDPDGTPSQVCAHVRSNDPSR